MADIIADARNAIEHRINQLDEERKRLEEALTALLQAGAHSAGSAVRQAGQRGGRRKSTAKRGATATKPKRRSGSGGSGKRGRKPIRAQQTLDLIRRNPGITIRELSQKMKITPNYLYRVVPKLQNDGLIKKSGKGYTSASGK